MRKRAREVLDTLERENRLGIVMLGRVYHHDPGLNHEIMEEFQKLGYPVFSQSLLPMDEDLLDRLFGEEVRSGAITHALDIRDVWKNAYSASTNQKIWAAKFTARHPNLVALEISNFKCGHDAPIYSVIEDIIENSGTPYFSFKDLDENKPTGSIKIRVETIDYFLKRYQENSTEEGGGGDGTGAPAGRVRALVAYAVDAESRRSGMILPMSIPAAVSEPQRGNRCGRRLASRHDDYRSPCP